MKIEPLSKNEPELADLENSCLFILQKIRKYVWKRTLRDVNHGINQPSQQKPRIEMGLYQWKNCQLGLAEEMGQNEGSLSNFLDPIGLDHRPI